MARQDFLGRENAGKKKGRVRGVSRHMERKQDIQESLGAAHR